jgi:hypothetical protein
VTKNEIILSSYDAYPGLPYSSITTAGIKANDAFDAALRRVAMSELELCNVHKAHRRFDLLVRAPELTIGLTEEKKKEMAAGSSQLHWLAATFLHTRFGVIARVKRRTSGWIVNAKRYENTAVQADFPATHMNQDWVNYAGCCPNVADYSAVHRSLDLLYGDLQVRLTELVSDKLTIVEHKIV